MKIGRYESRGRGGAINGRICSHETRHKISESVILNNKSSQIYQETHKRVSLNKAHGDEFFMAFDYEYGLFDLDILRLAKAVKCGGKLW